MEGTIALIGAQEGMVVLVAILVLFGGQKIPELMRGVGQGIGELKKGLEEGQRQLQDQVYNPPADTTTRLDQHDVDGKPKS